MVGGQVRRSQLMAVTVRAMRLTKPWLPGIASPSPATPTTGLRCQYTHLNLLFIMLPFILDESALIVGTIFLVETVNFASLFKSNGALF